MTQLCMPFGLPNNEDSTALSFSADLNKTAWWAKTWGMFFSAEKGDVLTIAGKRKDHPETDVNMERISMDGVLVPVCQKKQTRWSANQQSPVVVGSCWRAVHDVCSKDWNAALPVEESFHECLTKIYIGYIRPRLEYACAIWSGGSTSKLCRLHERFRRRHQARLPSLEKRFKYLTLVMFSKITNGLCPTYLSDRELLPDTLARSSHRELRRVVYPVLRVNKSSSLCSFFPRGIIFFYPLFLPFFLPSFLEFVTLTYYVILHFSIIFILSTTCFLSYFSFLCLLFLSCVFLAGA